MGKSILIVCGILAFAGVTIYFVTQQQSMQKQLADLQRKATQPATQASTGPAVVISVATQNDSATAREAAIHSVISEGYRLLDTRQPANAEKAIVIFKEGLEKVDPGNSDMLHGMGRAQLICGRYKEAQETFKQGMKVAPKKADLASGLGWAYYDDGDFYHAKEAWELAISLDPKSNDAWSVMAWVYLGLHERDKAIEGFRVLVDSPEGAKRTDWKNGLTMARASNYQLDQIRSQFKQLPDPALFTTPPATKP